MMNGKISVIFIISTMLTQQGRPEGISRQPIFIPMQQHPLQNHPQQRIVQHFSPIPIYQPVPIVNPPQQGLHSKNFSSPSLNVKQLSQDLSKLKQQLKKLTERGEEMGANKVRAQEANSARLRLQSIQQVHQIKAEQQRPKDVSNDLIYYPSTTSQVANLDKKMAQDLSSPPKREPYLQRPEERGKIMAFRNPNKQEQQKTNNNEVQEAEKARLEADIKQLRQKVSKLETDLQISLLQKENLTLQVKSLQQSNEQLRGQIISKEREVRSKSLIQTTSPSKDELKSSIIIQKLQNELAQMKKSTLRASFDQALKSQLQENKLLKVRLEQRSEQLQQVQDLLSQQQKLTESLKNQLSLLQLKFSTQLRGKQRKLQVQISDKANQLQTAKRALETLELKYRNAVGQIKEKDEFIMKYLVGRGRESQREEIMTLLEQYRINFPQNRTVQDLLKQQREIQSLKEQLKKLTQNK